MPDPRLVDQVAQMFPQLGRRDVAWDLQRNGGSVAATTERILGGRGLDVVSAFLSYSQLAGFGRREIEGVHDAIASFLVRPISKEPSY